RRGGGGTRGRGRGRSGRGSGVRSRSGGRGGRPGDGERQDEARTETRWRRQGEVAARLACDLARDIEPQPRAATALGRRKGPEQALRELRRDTLPVVPDRHRHSSIL